MKWLRELFDKWDLKNAKNIFEDYKRYSPRGEDVKFGDILNWRDVPGGRDNNVIRREIEDYNRYVRYL